MKTINLHFKCLLKKISYISKVFIHFNDPEFPQSAKMAYDILKEFEHDGSDLYQCCKQYQTCLGDDGEAFTSITHAAARCHSKIFDE